LKVVFSDRARLRLHQIRSDIAEDSPTAAERVVVRIRQTVELLADFGTGAYTHRRVIDDSRGTSGQHGAA